MTWQAISGRRYRVVTLACAAARRAGSSTSTLLSAANTLSVRSASSTDSTGVAAKGLTLVHFSAQRKRFLWDRG